MRSDKYQALYQQMHNDGHYNGDYHSPRIWMMFEDFFVENNCKTVLDFGSGKGMHWEKYPWKCEYELTLYDPYWPPLSQLPPSEKKFDMIMSKDCLEHIPIDTLEECIQWMYRKARICIAHFLVTGPATKSLPNGENAHCTVMDVPEYVELFKKHAKPGIETILFTGPKELIRF